MFFTLWSNLLLLPPGLGPILVELKTLDRIESNIVNFIDWLTMKSQGQLITVLRLSEYSRKLFRQGSKSDAHFMSNVIVICYKISLVYIYVSISKGEAIFFCYISVIVFGSDMNSHKHDIILSLSSRFRVPCPWIDMFGKLNTVKSVSMFSQRRQMTLVVGNGNLNSFNRFLFWHPSFCNFVPLRVKKIEGWPIIACISVNEKGKLGRERTHTHTHLHLHAGMNIYIYIYIGKFLRKNVRRNNK